MSIESEDFLVMSVVRRDWLVDGPQRSTSNDCFFEARMTVEGRWHQFIDADDQGHQPPCTSHKLGIASPTFP